MSTWMRSVGDTERFAVRLAFEHDPDKEQFDDPGYGGSWGSLQLWIDGLNVTAWRAPGGDAEDVHWYLLPFLEWVAREWFPLLHEERLPLDGRQATAAEAMVQQPAIPLGLDQDAYYGQLEEWQRWWSRHALGTAAEGGIFPRLYIRRWGDLVEVSWRSEGLVGAPDGFRFLVPGGVGRLPSAEVARVLQASVSEATTELLDRYPQSPRLLELRASVAAIARDTEERASAWLVPPAEPLWGRVRARLATTRQDVSDALLRPVTEGAVLTEAPQLAVLFGSAAPHVTLDDVDRLTGLAVDAFSVDVSQAPDLGAYREAAEAAGLPDYEQGNLLAEDVAAEFNLLDTEPVDVLALLERLGVSSRWVALDDSRIRAVTLLVDGGRALCAFNENAQVGDSNAVLRFSAAHELCHLLFDRYRSRRLAVASGPWAPREIERRANAFAAALLMPRTLLDHAAADSAAPYGSARWVRDIAATAETSVSATLERLGNLGLLDETARDDLRQGVAPAADRARARHWL